MQLIDDALPTANPQKERVGWLLLAGGIWVAALVQRLTPA
ncbi:MAG: hypothetical protein RIS88_1841 [Pseudomonadota bacterium]|jgi:hypothetical protein